jgi:hypothetical protein
MLSDYLLLIEKQRLRNPNYKKDYRLIYLPRLNTSFNNTLVELNKYPNAFLSNIVKREHPLYADNNDIFYYEFIDIGVSYNTNLEDWRYFYIPLSKFSLIENRLSTFKYYDVNLYDSIKTFKLDRNFMFLSNRITTEFRLETDKNKHPLLSHFLFTGVCSLLKTGEMLYEYKDIKNYADEESVSYFSFLEPLDIYIYSSYLNNNQLEQDINLIDLIEQPPSKYNLFNKLELELEFTGRSTTNKFSSQKKWYEYYIVSDGFYTDQIILPSIPTNKNLNFVKQSFYNKNIGVYLPTNISNQNISINQTSLNIPINLAP